MKVPTWARDILSGFENHIEPCQEVEIGEALASARKLQGDQCDDEWKGFIAEWAAFLFDGMHGNRESIWGTHFSPMMSVKQDDGGEHHTPDIKDLDVETVSHWETRAKDSRNPMMRARYADLAWDLKKAITGERPNVEFARIAVDSYLEAADKKLYPMEMFGIDWLKRALQLALSINDTDRAKLVVDFMFRFYDREAKTNLAGTWLFLFDSLYGLQCITAEQEARVIGSLETMFARVTNKTPTDSGVYETLDPWAAEAAAERLAKYYRGKGDATNVERVIRGYGSAFEHMAREASPMLATAWLQPVIERYEQEGLRQEAEDRQVLAGERAKRIASDLKTISVQSNIKQEDVEKMVENLLGSGDLRTSLARTAQYFIPKVNDTRNLLEKLRTDAPFLSMISLNVIETGGFTTAKIGSLDEDFEGRLHNQLGKTIGFYQPFLEYTL